MKFLPQVRPFSLVDLMHKALSLHKYENLEISKRNKTKMYFIRQEGKR